MSHNISYTPLYTPLVHQTQTLPIVQQQQQQPQQQQQVQQQQISFQFTPASKQQQPQSTTISSYGSTQLLAQPIKTSILGSTATPAGVGMTSNVLRQSWQQQQQQQQQQPPTLTSTASSSYSSNQGVISGQAPPPVIQTWVQSYQPSQSTQLPSQPLAGSSTTTTTSTVPSKLSLQLPQSFSFTASLPQMSQPWSTMNITSSSNSSNINSKSNNATTNTRRSQTIGLLQPIVESTTSTTGNIHDGISINVANERIDISCSKLITQLSGLVDTLRINQIPVSNKTTLVNSLHEVEEQIAYLRGQLSGLLIPSVDRLHNQEQQLEENKKKIPMMIDSASIKENNSTNNAIAVKSESSRVNRLKDSLHDAGKDQIIKEGESTNSLMRSAGKNKSVKKLKSAERKNERSKSKKSYKNTQDAGRVSRSPPKKNNAGIVLVNENNNNNATNALKTKENQQIPVDIQNHEQQQQPYQPSVESGMNDSSGNKKDNQTTATATIDSSANLRKSTTQDLMNRVNGVLLLSDQFLLKHAEKKNLRKSIGSGKHSNNNNAAAGSFAGNDGINGNHSNTLNLEQQQLIYSQSAASSFQQSAYPPLLLGEQQIQQQSQIQISQTPVQGGQAKHQDQEQQQQQQQQPLKIAAPLKDEIIEQQYQENGNKIGNINQERAADKHNRSMTTTLTSTTATTLLVPQVLPNPFVMKSVSIEPYNPNSSTQTNINQASQIKENDSNKTTTTTALTQPIITSSAQQDKYFLPYSSSPKQQQKQQPVASVGISSSNNQTGDKQLQKIQFGQSIPTYEPLSRSFDVKPIGPFVAVSPIPAYDTNRSLQQEQQQYNHSDNNSQLKYLNTSSQLVNAADNSSNSSYSNIKDHYANNSITNTTNDLIHLSVSQIGIDKNANNSNIINSIPAVILPPSQSAQATTSELASSKALAQVQSQQQQSQPLKASLKTSIPFQDVQHGLKSSIPLTAIPLATQQQQTAQSSLKSSLPLAQPFTSPIAPNLSNSYNYNNNLSSYPQASAQNNSDAIPKFVDLVHSQYTGYGSSGDKQQSFLTPGPNGALGDSHILNSPAASLGFNVSNIQLDKLQQTPFSAFSATATADKPNLNSLARNITGLNSAFSPELVQSSHSLTQPKEEQQQQQPKKNTFEAALNCKVLKSDDEEDDDDEKDQVPEIQPFIKEEESTAAKAKKYLRKLKSSKSFFLPLYTEKNPFDYSLQNFCVGKKLGHGKFADVFAAFDKETGFRVALKQIKKSTIAEFKLSQDVINEIRIQSQLSHPSIIQLYGFFIDEDSVYLIQELACGQELFAEQKAQPYKKFSESQAVGIVKQVIEALIYMHQKQVIHRDIKPENIMVYNGLVKICDFGYATFIKENTLRKTFCGTLDYISPEMVQAEPYDYSVDVWSIGILTYELIIGNVPFQGKDHDDTFDKIVNSALHFGRPVSFEAADFITKILEREPSKRMSIYECLSHPFIQGEDMKRLQNEQKSAVDIADLNKL